MGLVSRTVLKREHSTDRGVVDSYLKAAVLMSEVNLDAVLCHAEQLRGRYRLRASSGGLA